MSDITTPAQSADRIISDMKQRHGDKETYAPFMRWDEFMVLVEALEKESGYASAYEAEKWHYHQLAESEGERAGRAERRVAELEQKNVVITNQRNLWHEKTQDLERALKITEARTLTVKLPEKSIYRADEMVKEVGASVFAVPIAVVMDALGESGIKLQIEGE